MPSPYDENNPLHIRVYQEVAKQAFNDNSFMRWAKNKKAHLLKDGRAENDADFAVSLDALVELKRCTNNAIQILESSSVRDSKEEIESCVKSAIRDLHLPDIEPG